MEGLTRAVRSAAPASQLPRRRTICTFPAFRERAGRAIHKVSRLGASKASRPIISFPCGVAMSTATSRLLRPAGKRQFVQPPRARQFSWFSFGGESALRHHTEERDVEFNSDVVYGVVADVSRYKEFVPYTIDSKIVKVISSTVLLADLTVGYGPIHQTYRSRVVLNPQTRTVVARAEDSSVFTTLTNRWQIQDIRNGKMSRLKFSLDFQFRSAFQASIADTLFDRVSSSTVNAFLRQIKEKQEEYRRVDPDLNGQRILLELKGLSHFELAELERIVKIHGGKAIAEPAFAEIFCELLRLSGTLLGAKEMRKCSTDIFRCLDLNRDGILSLHEFTSGLSTAARGTLEERTRMWFRCYDTDGDGVISEDGLFDMIKYEKAVRDALTRSGFVKETPVERMPGALKIPQLAAQYQNQVPFKAVLEHRILA